MQHVLAVILATAISTLNTAAEAGQFDGWCFMQDECAGPSKIQNNQFATCEENCELTKPTKVSGLNTLPFLSNLFNISLDVFPSSPVLIVLL